MSEASETESHHVAEAHGKNRRWIKKIREEEEK